MSEEKSNWQVNINIGGAVTGQVGAGQTVQQTQQNAPAEPSPPEIAQLSPEEQAELNRLRQAMRAAFNEAEVQDICFTLGVNYEDLPGRGLAHKIRDLIAFMARQDQLEALREVCRRQRPSQSW